jgi:hypothetical protein
MTVSSCVSGDLLLSIVEGVNGIYVLVLSLRKIDENYGLQ